MRFFGYLLIFASVIVFVMVVALNIYNIFGLDATFLFLASACLFFGVIFVNKGDSSGPSIFDNMEDDF